MKAGELVNAFSEKFWHVACQELLEIDFSIPGAYESFRSSGIAEKNVSNKNESLLLQEVYRPLIHSGRGTDEQLDNTIGNKIL